MAKAKCEVCASMRQITYTEYPGSTPHHETICDREENGEECVFVDRSKEIAAEALIAERRAERANRAWEAMQREFDSDGTGQDEERWYAEH